MIAQYRFLFPLYHESKLDQDTSYASAAFMAKGSFCKACSLGKDGIRPSYAKDTKIFHSYIVSKEIFVDSTIHIADFYGLDGCIDTLVTFCFIVHTQCCLCKSRALVMCTNLPLAIMQYCMQLYLLVLDSLSINHFLHTRW